MGQVSPSLNSFDLCISWFLLHHTALGALVYPLGKPLCCCEVAELPYALLCTDERRLLFCCVGHCRSPLLQSLASL
jgi:hypothetical protein